MKTIDTTDRVGNVTVADHQSSAMVPIRPGRKRRTRVPDKPHYPLNLWSIMKNCIGKELSKIPMPVNFSEPLSMLQRLTEDYEYADILDKVSLYFKNFINKKEIYFKLLWFHLTGCDMYR